MTGPPYIPGVNIVGTEMELEHELRYLNIVVSWKVRFFLSHREVAVKRNNPLKTLITNQTACNYMNYNEVSSLSEPVAGGRLSLYC